MKPMSMSAARWCVVLLATLMVAMVLSAATPATATAQEPEGSAAVQEDHATEQDHAAEEEHAEPKPWFYWPSKWINFIALVALLWWMLVIPPPAVQDIFSFPGLKVIFVDRAAAVIAARDLAAQQKQDAAAMLTDSEHRLAKIEEEVAALVAEAREDAQREAKRALEDGKAQAEKIHAVAAREINHKRVSVQRQLRGFVADLAVNMAEKNLSEHLTAEDQDRLIREYLSRLGTNMA